MTMCALCRRNLLVGESFRRWRGRKLAERPVCGLCEEDARRAGWLPPQRADERENAVGLEWRVRKVA